MSQSKFRTRIVTAAALSLWPALALAQSGSTASPSQSSQGQSPDMGSQTAPSTDRETQSDMDRSQSSSDVQGSDMSSRRAQQGSMTSQDQAAMPKAPSTARIDPAEVQRVFGSDVSLVDLSSLDTEQVKQLQQHLQQRGHYQGTIDGIVGPKTRSGLMALLAQQYALEQRLVNQGQITAEIASSLGVNAEGRTPVRGVDMSGLPDQNQQQQRPNVQSFPPSNDQQRSTQPSNGQRGTGTGSSNPSTTPSTPSTPPSGSRTDDAQRDNYAPVTPR